MAVDEKDVDAQLSEWNPEETKPIELKMKSRRQWHMLLWLQLKTYKEIQAITGWGRNTIWEDIKWAREQLALVPENDQDVRNLTLMSLQILKTEIKETIDEAKMAEAPYNQIAKLYGEITGIDKLVLTRYTQPKAEAAAINEAEKRATIVIDFFVEKYGGEALDGFQEYYQRRLAQERVLPR